MRIKLFEEFINEGDSFEDVIGDNYVDIGRATEISIDKDTVEITFTDFDDWTDYMGDDPADQLRYFAKGQNDPLGSDIDDWFAEKGYELVYPGKAHRDSVTFKVKKMK